MVFVASTEQQSTIALEGELRGIPLALAAVRAEKHSSRAFEGEGLSLLSAESRVLISIRRITDGDSKHTSSAGAEVALEAS